MDSFKAMSFFSFKQLNETSLIELGKEFSNHKKVRLKIISINFSRLMSASDSVLMKLRQSCNKQHSFSLYFFMLLNL